MKSQFEWNPEKAKINLQKHQVDFDEASTIFDDPQFITFRTFAYADIKA
jgi:uncharacterized DUF497 family protein